MGIEPHIDQYHSELDDSLQDDIRLSDGVDGDARSISARVQPLTPGDAPSLPIILISAASGIAGGIIAFYITYELMGFGLAISAAGGTLGLTFGLGLSGAALTAATGERGAGINMVFSCALIVLFALFMSLCALGGGVLAILLARTYG